MHFKHVLFCVLFMMLLSATLQQKQQKNVTFDQISDVSDNHCKIECQPERFDLGKDCFETGNEEKCACVAHCCWAFDCRIWSMFAHCRKKCRIVEWSRFGKADQKSKVNCNRFPCPAHHLIDWDYRNVKDPEEINCIQHCCYAFNCKRYSGFCREACRAAR